MEENLTENEKNFLVACIRSYGEISQAVVPGFMSSQRYIATVRSVTLKLGLDLTKGTGLGIGIIKVDKMQ